jgi:uncharacterized protein
LGISQLRALLQRHRRIAFDSSILIYQIERNPTYFPLSDVVFAWLALPTSQAFTSTIVMTEVLVPAYRKLDQQLADNFYELLSTFTNLEWIPVDLEVADLAARVRARHNLRTPDAVHAATAIRSQASAFVTNDPIFTRIPDFEALILDRFI